MYDVRCKKWRRKPDITDFKIEKTETKNKLWLKNQ
jgi:hypothetical protein